MEIARIETQNIVNNTNKPLIDWEHDYTTDFLTKFRPISFLDDYDPYYIDSNYNRDPYWDDELYDQQQLQFHNNLSGQNDNNGTDEAIVDNRLTNALIHLWEPNEDLPTEHSQPQERTTSHKHEEIPLLDGAIFANVLISS